MMLNFIGERIKIALVKASGEECACCGLKDECYQIYDFHHLDPFKKDFELSRITTVANKQKISNEASKCILLCSNCHRKVTAGVLDVSYLESSFDSDKFFNILESIKADNRFIVARKAMKPVIQLDLNNDIISTFNSIKEASEKTGYNQSGISAVCTGRQKTSGGFKWRFVNPK